MTSHRVEPGGADEVTIQTFGLTKIFSLLAPKRGNISSLKTLGEILSISGISFTSTVPPVRVTVMYCEGTYPAGLS